MADQDARADEGPVPYVIAFGGYPLDLVPPTPKEASEHRRRFSYADAQGGWAIEGVADTSAEDDPRILSLTISALGGGAVNASLVKDVPVGKILASLQSLLMVEPLRKAAEEDGRMTFTIDALDDSTWARFNQRLAEEESAGQRTGRRAAMSDELLRDVAAAYLEETAPGKPGKPLARMAVRFDRPEETVRTWLSRARKAGWLGPGVRGRAGAEPGPRLLEWIATTLGADESEFEGEVSLLRNRRAHGA